MYFLLSMTLREFLYQPYPIEQLIEHRVRNGIFSALFVALFLGVFQPFGIQEIEQNKYFIIAGYGMVTFLAGALNFIVLPYLFPTFFTDAHWKIHTHILFQLYNIVIIACGNLYYSKLVEVSSVSVLGFTGFLFATLAVGIFPTIFFTYIAFQSANKRYATEAQELTTVVEEHLHYGTTTECHTQQPIIIQEQTPIPNIIISEDEGKQTVTIIPDELFFIAAADNYVEILHAQSTTPVVLRTSLKNIELQQLPTTWYRCHRSYIVNLNKVRHVSGNSQGLKLQLNDDYIVPVARSKSKELRELLIHLG